MTPQDFQSFRAEFNRLSAALERYKRTAEESAQKADAYFHVLKPFPLSLVIAKADTWLKSESKFPTPAQWANVIVQKTIEIPILSAEDSREWLRAEQLRWEDTPCVCAECRASDVDEKPRRFVPVLDANDRDVHVRLSNGRVVTKGEWIHGQALFRWYRARADFYNRCVELGIRRDVLAPVAGAGKTRTPTRLGRL